MKSELEGFMAHGVLNTLQHIFRSGKLAPDLPAGEGHGRVIMCLGETGTR